MKRLLLLIGALAVALSTTVASRAEAECFIHNDSSGNSTHICDDYTRSPVNIGKTIDSVVNQAESTAPYQINYGRDSYMSDFGNDTLSENLDSGAVDNPGFDAGF